MIKVNLILTNRLTQIININSKNLYLKIKNISYKLYKNIYSIRNLH